MRTVFAGLLVICLAGCDRTRVYEEYADLPSAIWLEDSVKIFKFQIEADSQPYNLYANFTSKIEYPYYNLYYQYSLKDSLGRTVKSGLLNAILFDAKTGEPLGSGIGDIFDQRTPIIENYHFPTPGSYSITLQQYMRTDTLPGIRSVGLRVEASVEN